MSMMEYVYETLDYSAHQIRLFTLEAAVAEDTDIRGCLRIVNLSTPSDLSVDDVETELEDFADVSQYEALSYAWGSTCERSQIHVDGHVLSVTQSLGAILRRLRRPHEARILWIDAICIDQNNVVERNNQVRQMRDVYSQASGVLIWLGEFDADMKHALAKCIPPDEDIPIEEIQELRQDDMFSRGIRKIFNLSWWTRLWVVQEYIVAKTDPMFLCGDTETSWEFLAGGLSQILTIRSQGLNMAPMLGEAELEFGQVINLIGFMVLRWGRKEKASQQSGLREVLEPTRGRETTDERDQIFSLLSLLPRDHKIQSILDYAKSVEEVYRETTLQLFEGEAELDLLTEAIHKGNSKLPSWCIDFSQGPWDITRGPDLESSAAGHMKSPSVFYDAFKDTLKLSGVRVGTINALQEFPAFDNKKGYSELNQSYGAFCNSALEVLSLSPVGEDGARRLFAQGIFWEAIAGQLYRSYKSVIKTVCIQHELDPAMAEIEALDWRMVEECIHESPNWASLLPDLPESEDLVTAIRHSLQVLVKLVAGSTMVATDSGHVAMANGHPIAEGDILCIIFGCWKPAVLRPCGDAYELIAFAWVPGIMYGEAITDQMDVQDFVLR